MLKKIKHLFYVIKQLCESELQNPEFGTGIEDGR